jgi:hypothetical protein
VVSSPYTVDEKFGLLDHPAYSLASTPDVDGIPKEYRDYPLLYTDVEENTIPVRKYSRKWWKKTWNKGIEGRIWPRIVYGVVFLIVMAVWLCAV